MPASRKSLTKVVYKPDTQSTDEFTVIVNSDEVSGAHPQSMFGSLMAVCSTRSGKKEVSYLAIHFLVAIADRSFADT